jgi:hypothetical protein
MEIYKDIQGYEGIYQISNLGNVKSLKYNKERVLNKELSKGYYRFNLCFNNKTKHFLSHRLVALNFIDNYDNKQCVNHKDGNKLNNSVENLEWVSYSENEIHSYKTLNKINTIRKLKIENVTDILNNCIKGKKGNVFVFMNIYNVDRKTILNVLNKKYYV